ncbi:hypothetical protein CEXT_281081 [Caerostris extrusa]|uniref:Uncharacterized protein n=1 Tax=Caerostris extrusa TaxID=172846 RepID=A0AAV4QEP8_CAEEX|nr:hypothetical protein CEXT_281081 [Caerostris extrusa]
MYKGDRFQDLYKGGRFQEEAQNSKIYANADWEEIQAQVDQVSFEQNRLRIVPGDLSWIGWRVSYCERWIVQWESIIKCSTRKKH